MITFETQKVACWDLSAGDTLLVGVNGGRETRTVLGVLQQTPMNGALLEVVGPDGNVHRSHCSGHLDVIRESTEWNVPLTGVSKPTYRKEIDG